MYTSFNVKNFRGFSDLRLSDFDRVNLIAGRNNSGKTALMEAIYTHAGNRSSKTLLRPLVAFRFEDFLIRSLGSTINAAGITSWASLFLHFDTQLEIKMEAEFDNDPRKLATNEEVYTLWINTVSPDRHDFLDILREFDAQDDDVSVLEFKTGYESEPFYILLSEERTRTSRSKSQTLFQSGFIQTREPTNPKDDNDRLSDMKQSKTDTILVDALRMLETRLAGLEILYDRIHADVGIGKSIPLSSMGDGMNRIASIILAMSSVPGGVMFVDEIENGLHHLIQEDVWRVIGKLARNLDIQFFATTHSLEMIRAAHEAFKTIDLYDFRLHRLDRHDESGDITAVTYNERGMKALETFDFDFEVRG